jgi:hypothetical protein
LPHRATSGFSPQAGDGFIDDSTLRESTGAGGGGSPNPDMMVKVRKSTRRSVRHTSV